MRSLGQLQSAKALERGLLLVTKLCLGVALLMATDAVCIEIDSVSVDTKQGETNVAVFFDGNPEFSAIQLESYNSFLELKIYDATVNGDTPINIGSMSELVKGVEVIQRGRSAVVRIETEGNAKFIKEAAKIGRYQDQLMLTVDHVLIQRLRDEAKSSPIIASKERIFDLTFYAFLVAMLCLAIVFKGRGQRIPRTAERTSSKVKMQTLATIPPTKTHQLSMVEIGNQKLLIANGPTGVQLLTAFPLQTSPVFHSSEDSPEKLKLIQQLREQIKLKNIEKDTWGSKS